MTKFIPKNYEFFKEAFLVGGLPVFSEGYEGFNDLALAMFGSAGAPLMKADLTEDETERVTYDYNQLVNIAFQEGMASFAESLNSYDILYRQ